MTTKTKIIIGILIVVAIIIAIFGFISNKMKDVKKNNKDELSSILEYINGTNENYIEVSNGIAKNETEENTIQNTVEENEVNNTQTNNVIGKEEQESNNENTEKDNKQIAIDLAKEEWGISIDSYDFQANLKSEGIYEVSVINKTDRTVITIYNVNIKTGTVTE